jgi:hypothetical protein
MGGSKKLGEVFFKAVVGANFQTEASRYPLLRSALVATDLISPNDKVSDGYAGFSRSLM